MVALAATASLEKYEAVIANGMRSFVEIGNALATIRDRRLYKEAGFETFEAYCKERWSFAANYARKQIAAAAVVGSLSGTIVPSTESQVRPLLKLPPESLQEVWLEVIETAPDGKVTASHVAATVSRRLPPETPARWHLMVETGALKDAVHRLAAKWPEKHRRLIPDILRDIASELESDSDG